MKHLYWLAILVLFSCNHQQETKNSTSSKQQKVNKTNFDWLLGSWTRKNDKEGQKTYEYWQKTNDNLYRGIGYTLEGSDTVFMEALKILSENGKQQLVIENGKEKPVGFLITKQTRNGFTCENEQNEFPKKIEYQLEGNQLIAVISADEMSIPFIFEKVIAK